MKVLILAALALIAVSQLASAACHNATGSCTHEHFVCANEETIPHAKRCDGVEDCADGTDEYMCDQASTPLWDLSVAERTAITEVSCIKCTCYKGQVMINNGQGSWWKAALAAPRDFTMMTNSVNFQNKACNPAQVTQIQVNVYKKQNKGCRGWVCCLRQQACISCAPSGNTASHCY